jgi:hypothetical protein
VNRRGWKEPQAAIISFIKSKNMIEYEQPYHKNLLVFAAAGRITHSALMPSSDVQQKETATSCTEPSRLRTGFE